jgi:hypothetical protein
MRLDTVSRNVCRVLFYVSAFMLKSNVDSAFPDHRLFSNYVDNLFCQIIVDVAEG